MKFNQIVVVMALIMSLLQPNIILAEISWAATVSLVDRAVEWVTKNKSTENYEKVTSALKEQAVQQAAANSATQAGLTEIKDGVDNVTALGVLAAVGSVYTIVKGTYDFGCFVKSHVSPSEQEKLNKQEVSRRLAHIIAFRELNDCLVSNERSKKDEEGMPYACTNSIEAFKRVAGYDEFNQIKSSFKKCTEKYAA